MPSRSCRHHPADVSPNEIAERTSIAASYARKSSLDPVAVDDQHLSNSQLAAREGHQIPEGSDYRFGDDDTTGATVDREALNRLLALVRSNRAEFTRVYFRDYSRVSRTGDLNYLGWLTIELQRFGVDLRICEEDHHLDATASPEELMLLHVRRAIGATTARKEWEETRKRCQRGILSTMRRGFFPGAHVPYGTIRWLADRETGQLFRAVEPGQGMRKTGYQYKLVWAADERYRTIHKIFRLLSRGIAIADVARHLEAIGAPAPRAAWDARAARKIARNPLYYGDLVWRRDSEDSPVSIDNASTDALLESSQPIIVPAFLPDAPVSRELFERVQSVLDGNRVLWDRRRSTKPEYLLSGLVRCASCNASWHGHTGRFQSPDRSYYRHGHQPQATARKAKCEALDRYIRMQVLEDRVVELMLTLSEDDVLPGIISEEIARKKTELGSAEAAAELERLDASVQRAGDLIAQLAMDKAEAKTASGRQRYAALLEAKEMELSALEARRDSMLRAADDLQRAADQAAQIASGLPRLRHILRHGSTPQQKGALADMIAVIRVDPGLQEFEVALRGFG